MHYIGIDIAKDTHYVAVVDADEQIVVRGRPFKEDANGYAKLIALIEPLADSAKTLVVMEATGHYWQNLFGFLVGKGYPVALINPIRSHHFAKEDLRRAKTDAADALMLARFGRQKRPQTSSVPDESLDELKEAVRLRDRLVQDLGDKVRQLHHAVDVGFPEFTRHIKNLGTLKAVTVLKAFPSARKMAVLRRHVRVSRLVYDGRHSIGKELAEALIAAAKRSVGSRSSETHHTNVVYLCEDIELLLKRIGRIDDDIERQVSSHELGSLLSQIDGVGPQTVARVLSEVGDPASFRSAAALASYVGVVPNIRHSGRRKPARAGTDGFGNARLRSALWMPTLTAVRVNPWLRAFYQRLISKGKPKKLALIAAMRKLITAIYVVAKKRQPFVYEVPNSAESAC